jgi:hypothetical protein
MNGAADEFYRGSVAPAAVAFRTKTRARMRESLEIVQMPALAPSSIPQLPPAISNAVLWHDDLISNFHLVRPRKAAAYSALFG